MALAMMAVPSVPAMAADGDITLYLKLTDGSKNTDWAANTWGGTVVDSSATQINKPTGWGDGTLPQLAADEEGWAKIKINVSEGIGGWQWIKYNSDGSLAAQVENWNTAIVTKGLTEAYYDLATSKWYEEKSCTNEIKMSDVAEKMYVIGGGAIFGEWTLGNAIEMTKSGDTYSVVLRKVPAGTYSYKFLQDAPTYGWSYQAGANNAVKCGEGEDAANIDLTVKELSDVTLSITVSAKKGGDKYDATAMTEVTIAEPVLAAPAVTADEVIKAINDIGTVTLESEEAIKNAEALYAAAPEGEKEKVTNYATLTEDKN